MLCSCFIFSFVLCKRLLQIAKHNEMMSLTRRGLKFPPWEINQITKQLVHCSSWTVFGCTFAFKSDTWHSSVRFLFLGLVVKKMRSDFNACFGVISLKWFKLLMDGFLLFPSRKIPQATDLQSPPSSVKTITSSSPSLAATSSSSLHSKVRTGSYISSSLKMASSSSSSRGPGRPPTAVQSENSGGSGGSISSGHLALPSKPVAVRQMALGRPKNPVGRPSKQMLKLREEAAAAAALRKRKAPSQEGEHSGPDRNCIILQDRGRPPSSASSSPSSFSSSKPTLHSPLPHGQTNGTLSPSSKPRPQPSPSESHSPAAKAVWTYRRTHAPLGHSSPPDHTSATNNSHNRGGVGDSGLHGQGSGRGFEHQGLVKKRKGGAMEEHSPSSKTSAHRLPSSSSSSATSSSPCSNFYPWKDSKGGGLAGGVEKKLGTQKVSLWCTKIQKKSKLLTAQSSAGKKRFGWRVLLQTAAGLTNNFNPDFSSRCLFYLVEQLPNPC